MRCPWVSRRLFCSLTSTARPSYWMARLLLFLLVFLLLFAMPTCPECDEEFTRYGAHTSQCKALINALNNAPANKRKHEEEVQVLRLIVEGDQGRLTRRAGASTSTCAARAEQCSTIRAGDKMY